MRKRYYNLDIIKIVAAVIIVCHHYQQISGIFFSGVNFYGGKFSWGYLVELFFMISGFLTVYNDRCDEHCIKSFLHKCKRIYPMAIFAGVVLIAIVFCYRWEFDEWIFNEQYGMWNIITSLLLIHQGWIYEMLPAINNPTWYLCVLILCYIIFYLIKAICRKIGICLEKRWILYVIIVLISAYALHTNISLPFFRLSSQRGYSSFFMGCLLCLLVDILEGKKLRKVRRGLLIIAIIEIAIKNVNSWSMLVFVLYPMVVLYAVTLKQIPSAVITKWGGVLL